jgi:hypothetical protein
MLHIERFRHRFQNLLTSFPRFKSALLCSDKPGANPTTPKLTTTLGPIIHTWVKNYRPRYKTIHLGTKLFTWVQNYRPACKTIDLGTKLLTWVQNYRPGYKATTLGTKLQTRKVRKYPQVAKLRFRGGSFRNVILNWYWHSPNQGCQILLGALYQNRKKCTKGTQNVKNGLKISKMSLKYSKWPWNI